MTKARMRGLYNIIDFVCPGYLSTWMHFKSTFLVTQMVEIKRKDRVIKQEEVVAIRNESYLNTVISNILITGAIKYDLRWHNHQTPLTEDERDHYRLAGKGILTGKQKEGFAERLHDLQKVVDNSHEAMVAQQQSVSSKERLLIAVLKKLLDQDFSAVVYCEHLATVDRLQRILNACLTKGVLQISNLFCLTGKVSKKSRDAIEDDLTPRSIVLVTRAGTQSRNLQRANQAVLYDIPFSVGVVLQFVGRVTRCDSTFSHMDVHIIEAEGTIDTYKRMLMQDNAAAIEAIFGGNPNLPDIKELDRRGIRLLRRRLLWSFGKKSAAAVSKKSTP
jgi:hypothetical protein